VKFSREITKPKEHVKSLKGLLFGMALMTTILAASAADEKSTGVHWYQVAISQPRYYAFVGTSTMSEADLTALMAREDGFIKLENLVYRDNNGKYKSWHDWDPTTESRIYLRSKAVISIQPLVGDPSKIPDMGSK
jgi:hypothetical protein